MILAIIQNYDRKYGDAEGLLKEALGIKPPARTRQRSCSSWAAPTPPGAAGRTRRE